MEPKQRVRKPEWLKISIGANERYTETKRIVESHCLHTICSSGRCPNMGECWGRGTATFMIGAVALLSKGALGLWFVP